MTIELARSYVLLNSSQFRMDFYSWLFDNYHVFEYFEQSALKVWGAGFTHYSARTIVEVMRHRSNVKEILGEYNLNNNRTPDMARLYMLLHPEHKGLFEFRERKAA